MQQTAGEGWGDAEICRFLLGTNAAQLHGTYLPMWFMQRNHANKYKAALAVENERNLPDGRKTSHFSRPAAGPPPRELPHPPVQSHAAQKARRDLFWMKAVDSSSQREMGALKQRLNFFWK